ncbi:hypothetical protein PMAYCL1PPCAC_28624, partial [Pristionchus mayeri]
SMSGKKIHFKVNHGGITRRFALSRDAEDLISALKARVLEIIGAEDVQLYWRDEDSQIVLGNEDDMNAAIDYAETKNKLGCVSIETGAIIEKRGLEVRKDVTMEESKAAFGGNGFQCDGCLGWLGEKNGGRFMCTICDNFDFCSQCFAK